MAEAAQQPRLRDSFERGLSAGLIVLVLWFIIRLGGLAPYPPESALVSFFSVIPESIQEPAVQALGEAAGLLGLVIAVAMAAILYGLLAVGFERYFLPKAPVTRRMSRLESTLVFTAVPWLLFGLVILPLTGESFFGLNSNIASGTVAMAFPFATLLIQLLWGVLLFARTPSGTATPAKVGVGPTGGMVPKDVDRRTFIERGLVLAGSAVLVLASLGSAVGALISEGGLLSLGGVSIRPGASINAGNVPLIFSDPRLGSLVNSEVTNNNSFYRVAIDIFDPNVSTSEWSLGLSGLVAKPKNYSFVDLQNLPKSQQYSTFICVSNVVNGDLISNAKWGGVRLSDLFEDAGGVLPSAAYVVFHSVDGYSVGIPIAKALEQGSMLAYEMNDAALPQRHGYPLRAVIPGLYGMMSAKWIRHIELTDGVYLGYWQTRGWSNDATVQTAVFIRIPQDGASVSLSQNNGTVMLGGMAFAGDRGVSKVEVSVDGGKTWKEATLKPTASSLAWVLWAYEWIPPSVGQYAIYARATDGDGRAQSSAQSTPYPSGATGYSMSTLAVVS